MNSGRNRNSILPWAVRCAGAIIVAGVIAWLGAPAVAQDGLEGGRVPAALVGTWGFAVATGNYCNRLGHCAPGSGGSQSFTFRADGYSEYRLFESALVDGCGQIQTLTHKIGVVAVRGSSIQFFPRSGTYKAINGCRPDLTGTWRLEAKDLAPILVRWQFLPENALRLVDPTGKVSGVYSRR